MQRARASTGLTVVELLVVIAIAGILAVLVGTQLRTPAVRAAANEYRALLQQSRLEAVKLNRPVSVVWDALAGQFDVRAYTSGDTTTLATCGLAATTAVQSLDLDEFRAVGVVTDMTGNARLFQPDVRGGYFSPPGNAAILTSLGGGVFHLREADGIEQRRRGCRLHPAPA